jgi:hypothetical protein
MARPGSRAVYVIMISDSRAAWDLSISLWIYIPLTVHVHRIASQRWYNVSASDLSLGRISFGTFKMAKFYDTSSE